MPNVYIDASGNAGKRTQRREPPTYVLCAVFLGTLEIDNQISRIHSDLLLSWPKLSEFHYTTNHKASQSYILQMLEIADWCYAATIGFKDELFQKRLAKAASCQHWFVKRALMLQRKALVDGAVILDRGASSHDDELLLNALKGDVILNRYMGVQNADCTDSKASCGVQLADAIAGLINRCMWKQSRDALEVYQQLIVRETVLWRFPFDASVDRDDGLKPVAQQGKLFK